MITADILQDAGSEDRLNKAAQEIKCLLQPHARVDLHRMGCPGTADANVAMTTTEGVCPLWSQDSRVQRSRCRQVLSKVTMKPPGEGLQVHCRSERERERALDREACGAEFPPTGKHARPPNILCLNSPETAKVRFSCRVCERYAAGPACPRYPWRTCLLKAVMLVATAALKVAAS